jgi:hypothetical protein
MEAIKKLLRTPSALALIVVAIITLIGVIFQSNSSKAVVQLSIDATSTAEAKQGTNTFSRDVPIAISAQKGWQKTGVQINIGDKVDIAVVDGEWTTSQALLPSSKKDLLGNDYKNYEVFVDYARQWSGSGEGCTPTCIKNNVNDCPLPDSRWGRLIARIGLSNPLEIGHHSTFVSTYSGILELGMNTPDDLLKQSSGVLAVIIKVEKP